MSTKLNPGAQLARDVIDGKTVTGIPSWGLNIMEHRMIERLAEAPAGSYPREPEKTYLTMQRRIGTCMIDQYIPRNPLTMGSTGYEEDTRAPLLPACKKSSAMACALILRKLSSPI